MNTFLWIFIALAFGLLLFTSVQDKVPEELSFLRANGGNVATLGENQSGDVRRSFSYEGWSVRQEGPTIEFTKPFSGEIDVNGTRYDTPVLGILCHQGKLDVRVDTRMATTGTKTTQVTLSAGGRQTWAKGTDTNVFPSDPSGFVAGLAKAMRPLEMTVSYAELGNHTVTVNGQGLLPLVQQLPQGCKVA